MKTQLQTKHKLMLGIGAGLLGATAIATPLVISLNQPHKVANNFIDKKYGMDKAAYKKMMADCVNLFTAKLQEESLQPEEKENRYNAFLNSMKVVNNQVKQLKAQSTDNLYTVATSMLKRFVKKNYDLDVVRNSRANWNEVDDMFTNMLESFVTYMDNNHFEGKEITKVIESAQQRKVELVKKLKADYKNDVLTGVLKAKAQLFSLFDTVNVKIAKIAATIRLQEFLSNYSIQYRQDATTYGTTDKNYNRLDTLINDGSLTENEIIRDDVMDRIFVCFNTETRQLVNFLSSEMIPGYTIMPIYKGVNVNKLSNEQSIKIDWTIVSDQYINGDDEEAATAHLYTIDAKNLDVINNHEVHDLAEALDSDHVTVHIMEYEVSTSSDAEQTQMIDTYFNDKNTNSNGANIQFTWDDVHAQPCYDGFMYADQRKVGVEQTLSMRQLSQTGIVIKNGDDARLLSDVINLVEQDNYVPQNDIEYFVKNCDLKDNIVITHDAQGKSIVNNHFLAYYKNEQNWKNHFQESQGCVDLGSEDAVRFETSDHFFDLVNYQFNMAYNQSHIYMDKSYRKLSDKAEVLEAYIEATDVVAIMNVMAVTTEVVLLTVGEQKTDAARAIGLLVTETFFAVLTSNLAHRYENRYLTPILGYAARADKFTKGEQYTKVENKLNDDYHLFVVTKDSQVDPTTPEFIEKKEYFNTQLSDIQKQDLFTLYTNFRSDFAQLFFSQAIRLEIDPQKFRDDFADLDPDGPKSMFIAMFFREAAIVGLMYGIAMPQAQRDAIADATHLLSDGKGYQIMMVWFIGIYTIAATQGICHYHPERY